MTFAATMLVGFCLDVVLGWPHFLFARIGHPVVWIGRLVEALERNLNRGRRRLAGAVTVVVVLAVVLLPAILLQLVLGESWIGAIVGGVIAWPFIAARSMHNHVDAVARPLAAGDIAAARRAVGMIVGRDPDRLDEAGLARSALESLAENTSDGIVAPLFWGVVAGLPGLVAYKAINTMDSMIGHRNVRYEEFGKVAARLDDLVNLAPARLTGLLFGLASGHPGRAVSAMVKDARHHRSPNAGWPEAAMAAALGVRLSGPRVYADRVAEEPWINAGAPDPGPQALRQGLVLFRRTMMLTGAVLLGLAVL